MYQIEFYFILMNLKNSFLQLNQVHHSLFQFIYPFLMLPM